MNPNNLFYYFSMLAAYLWLPTQFAHLFFKPPCMAEGWNGKPWTNLQSTSKSWSAFYFILSFVLVFYLRSCWIMYADLDLISPIILAYRHSLSNYIDNGYVSFSLRTYYGHLAGFKWSWITLLICYQHLFTNTTPQNIASQLYLEKVMFHGIIFQSQPATCPVL